MPDDPLDPLDPELPLEPDDPLEPEVPLEPLEPDVPLEPDEPLEPLEPDEPGSVAKLDEAGAKRSWTLDPLHAVTSTGTARTLDANTTAAAHDFMTTELLRPEPRCPTSSAHRDDSFVSPYRGRLRIPTMIWRL